MQEEIIPLLTKTNDSLQINFINVHIKVTAAYLFQWVLVSTKSVGRALLDLFYI